MRVSVFIRSLPLLFVVASPALVGAQFQQPTNEELKMTADPKAPGTAAVYLYFEETTNDPQHYYSVYARIKVLQEKGKELATVELPYMQGNSRITDIKARTIHSDGTIIPLIGKPDDLLIVRAMTKYGDFEVNRKVFNLPSVEVGSILEYRYEIHYDEHRSSSPIWEIQRPYFIHQAHYSFTPFKGFLRGYQNSTSIYLVDAHLNKLDTLIWTGFLPKGTEVKSGTIGDLSVDMRDIPIAPNEEWMPPIKSILYRVIFYYKSAKTPTEFWESETKLWSKDVDHFTEPTMPLQDVVVTLVSPKDSDLDKAKKLYKAVQTLDNTDFSRKKGESERKDLKLKDVKRAEDVWAQKSGSSNNIALLYLTMLRAAGLTAYDMKVADRNLRVFDPTYLSFSQLDDDLVVLNIGGKDILLDPGQRMCPFQTVHWKHSGAAGIRQSADIRGLASTPLQVYSDNRLVRAGDITLDENGAISGRLNFIITGQEALSWRQTALRNDPAELTKKFNEWVLSIVPEGVETHVDHFEGIDNPESSLTVVVDVHGTLGSSTAKRLLLPGFFFQTRGHKPFINQKTRLTPVDMHFPDQVLDKMVYHLPAGLTIEGAPPDSKIAWEDQAVLNTKSVATPGQITISRLLSRAFTNARPEEYNDLRDFYQKVATADQQQLVLTRTARTETGN